MQTNARLVSSGLTRMAMVAMVSACSTIVLAPRLASLAWAEPQ